MRRVGKSGCRHWRILVVAEHARPVRARITIGQPRRRSPCARAPVGVPLPLASLRSARGQGESPQESSVRRHRPVGAVAIGYTGRE